MAASSYYAYSLCKKVEPDHAIKIKIPSSSKSLFWPSLKAAAASRNVFGGVGIMCSSSAAVSDEEDNTNKVRRRRVLKVGLICGGPSAERGI